MSSTNDATQPALIGWREWIAFPELAIPRIKAKVDTGARSSALSAENLHYFERDGVAMVRFDVHPRQRSTDVKITAEAPLAERRQVKSSTGHVTTRPVILTTVHLGGQTWTVELTLASRHSMGFRTLLGRQAVRGRFLVDPGKSYLTRRGRKRKKHKKRRSE